MKATTQQLEACARLSLSEKDFVSLLKSRLEECRRDAVTHRDEISMRWAQGRAQELDDIIKLIETSPDNLRKATR